MQEIREAVAEFRESGKLTVAWAETFGEFTHGNLPYYLATAFDRIYLQPSGTLGLTGVAVEQLFLHDALAKVGVGFQSAKRYEYKTAADTLTERGFTGPAREAAERLAVSVVEQISAAIAERRGKTIEDARALLDRGPFLAADALAEGLVDELGYRDEVYKAVRKEAGQGAILQYVGRYQRVHALAQRARRLPNPRERFVAVVYASGPIRQGRSSRGPVGGGAMGSDTVAAALRSARSDERVRAVLLRVNSPGGSAVASDTIWREVVRIRAAGQAGRGVDERRGRLRRVLHLDGGRRHRGPARHAHRVDRRDHRQARVRGGPGPGRHHHRLGGRGRPGPDVRPHPPVHRGRVGPDQRLAGRGLPGLHLKAAEGRRMPVERMGELARGRVWTGADAAANGLVDELGGMAAAAEIARRRAGLPAGAPLRIWPRLTPLDQLRPPESSEARPAAAAAPGLRVRRRLCVRGLGPGLAAGGPRLASAVRTADAPGHLDHQLTERSVARPPRAGDAAGALNSWTAGVTLVTVADGRDDVGATVSAFCPVSEDPPLVLVSLMAGSYPAELFGRAEEPVTGFAVVAARGRPAGAVRAVRGGGPARGAADARRRAAPAGPGFRRADRRGRARRAGVLGRAGPPGRGSPARHRTSHKRPLRFGCG